jgi:outer membrane protein OmpA-like peptidoglycan-associated protein
VEGATDREQAVTGVEVALETRGKGTSQAQASPQPAVLVFHLAMLRRVRSEAPQFKRLAELRGQLELRKGRDPVFQADLTETGDATTLIYEDPELNGSGKGGSSAEAGAEADLDQQAGDAPLQRPRMLELTFSSGSFAQMLDAAGGNARLLLPNEVNGAHYLELAAELFIAGSVEAALGTSDVLDVHITDQVPREAPHYELQVVDEVGEPLRGVELTLTEDGRDFQLRTDDDGRIFKLPLSGAGARVRFKDPALLKDLLKALWAEPRGKPRFEGGPAVATITPRDFDTSIELTTEVPVTVCVRPHVVLARLRGTFFDSNKSFLLPSALQQLPALDELYRSNQGAKLLIVGHTDTTADASTNDPLSLERADSMLAYLKDDRRTWLDRYASSIPEKRRWGRTEDLLMLRARPGFSPRATEDEEIRDFQASQGLEADGIIGPITREKLIELYMDRDGTSLPGNIVPTTHGCGENFPVDDESEELEPLAPDAKQDLGDRRVELFFFDGEFGILPPPPGKNSKAGSPEYPEWRRRSDHIRTLLLNTRTVRLFLLDPRYQRMPGAPYELVAGGVVRTGDASDAGLLEELEVPITGECRVRWGRVKGNFGAPAEQDPTHPLRTQGSEFEYFNVLNLNVRDEVENDLRLRNEARARLDNMGHGTARFNEDLRAHRARYELSPVDAGLSRATFDELAKIHREGTEAPLTEPQPSPPDPELEDFELDGEEAVELTLLDDAGVPIADQLVQVTTSAGVVRTARTGADGRVAFRGLEGAGVDVVLPGTDVDAVLISQRESENG